MLTAEMSLQSVGLSPLMFEVSLVLLRWYVTSCTPKEINKC